MQQDYVVAEIKSLKELVLSVLASTARRSVYTVADIARMKGVSPAHLRKVEPYLMPRFGESAYPDGPARWDISEYIEWDGKPIEDRRRAWQENNKKASV